MASAALKLSSPAVGDYYRHLKSGNEYIVKGVWSIKLEGQWHEGWVVFYAAMSDGKQYARLKPDFLSAFELITDTEL